jgi:hypothetical protein
MTRTLTLTPEQEAAYDAGQPFTVTPPRRNRYIVTSVGNNVYDVRTEQRLSPYRPQDQDVVGGIVLIAKGDSFHDVGSYVGRIVARRVASIVPVSEVLR